LNISEFLAFMLTLPFTLLNPVVYLHLYLPISTIAGKLWRDNLLSLHWLSAPFSTFQRVKMTTHFYTVL
jgi:hypothetical protein